MSTEPTPSSADETGAIGGLDNNPIPGSGVVGFGFNILGSYDISSLTSQIFTANGPSTTKTVNGVTYAVPFNMTYQATSSGNARSYVTQSQKDFTRTFAENANVSVSYGAFDGEFNQAYSQTFNSSQSYYYCWFDGSLWYFGLALEDQSLSHVDSQFLSDANKLPTEYTAENRHKFFDFFIKYGTHYISAVTLGASFRYYLAVETSYSSDQTAISANVALEYKALFGASAQSSAAWNTLTTNWASSRQVSLVYHGGNGSLSVVVSPGFGDNFSTEYSDWLASTLSDPAVVAFDLRRISLVCGEKTHAVDKALSDYLNSVIFVSAELESPPSGASTAFQISVFNKTIKPPTTPPMPQPTPPPPDGVLLPVGGFQLVLLDRVSLDPILNRVYYMPSIWEGVSTYATGVAALYSQMESDIASVKSDNHVAVLNGFGIESMRSFPPPGILSTLTDWGAKLEVWRQLIGSSDPECMLNYVLIGGPGVSSDNTVERCETVEWYTGNSLLTTAQMAIYAP